MQKQVRTSYSESFDNFAQVAKFVRSVLAEVDRMGGDQEIDYVNVSYFKDMFDVNADVTTAPASARGAGVKKPWTVNIEAREVTA